MKESVKFNFEIKPYDAVAIRRLCDDAVENGGGDNIEIDGDNVSIKDTDSTFIVNEDGYGSYSGPKSKLFGDRVLSGLHKSKLFGYRILSELPKLYLDESITVDNPDVFWCYEKTVFNELQLSCIEKGVNNDEGAVATMRAILGALYFNIGDEIVEGLSDAAKKVHMICVEVKG